MGKHGAEITGVDLKELLQMLNEALAEEWLAFYQYWIGARLMEGVMRSEIEQELLLHADQELNHAVMVVDRIIQLEGQPIITPEDWFKFSKCDYKKPDDPYIEVILQQNLEAERCAIKRYKSIADFTTGKDHSTYKMVTQILDEELEHEEDIQDWLEDIKRLKDDIKKIRM